MFQRSINIIVSLGWDLSMPFKRFLSFPSKPSSRQSNSMGSSSSRSPTDEKRSSSVSDSPPPYTERPSTSGSRRARTARDNKRFSEGVDSLAPRDDYIKLRPPPTARYILGLDDDSAHIKPVGSSKEVDPLPFEFELVCLRCWEFQQECTCGSNPVIAIPPSSLSATKKSYGEYPVPVPIIKKIGMRDTHFASAVAHATWPLTCRGMIPIFSADSLSVIRSRALDRTPDARTFLDSTYQSVIATPGAECQCGCREIICAQVALRHDLYNKPKELARATSTSYTFKARPNFAFSAVRLGNGKTCISSSAPSTPITEIDSDFEDDYLLCRRLWCIGWTDSMPSSKSKFISWDAVLSNILDGVLSRSPNHYLNFWTMTARRYIGLADGSRVVMRSENFGVGMGHLVMDLKETPYGTFNQAEGSIPSAFGMSQYVLDTSDFRSPSTLAVPRREKSSAVAQAEVGYGWSSVKIDVSSGDIRLRVASDTNPNSVGKVISPPRRPFKGQACSGLCAKKTITVDSVGFSPPTDQGKETSVYMLGNDAAPFIVVAQYAQNVKKEFYLVNYDECLACTILYVPRGCIVAGPLPKPFLK